MFSCLASVFASASRSKRFSAAMNTRIVAPGCPPAGRNLGLCAAGSRPFPRLPCCSRASFSVLLRAAVFMVGRSVAKLLTLPRQISPDLFLAEKMSITHCNSGAARFMFGPPHHTLIYTPYLDRPRGFTGQRCQSGTQPARVFTLGLSNLIRNFHAFRPSALLLFLSWYFRTTIAKRHRFVRSTVRP